MGRPSSVIDALLRRAEQEPGREAFRLVDRGGRDAEVIDYGELARRAAGAAARIAEITPPGAPVLLALPTGVTFLAAIYGTLLAGRVAIPAHPRRLRDSARLAEWLRLSGAHAVIADNRTAAAWRSETVPRLDLSDVPRADPAPRRTNVADLAVVQYSSGSTRAPRGVTIRHRAIAANSAMISAVFGHGPDTNFVNWLPLYHDMGLMGGVFQPVMLGAACALISPADFAARPRLWLETISRLRAHTSGGPDSAYRLCLDAIAAEGTAGLDLGSWRVAFNGSERVHAPTMRAFFARFAAAAFRPDAFLPCYGLAEATLLVSGTTWSHGQAAPRFDAAALERGEVEPCADGLEVVALGQPAPGLELRIVDPKRRTDVPPGRIGELELRGPSLSDSYFGESTRAPDAWTATGDLGFLHDGQLHLVGRKDDVIVQFGRNLFPDDLEAVAEGVVHQRGCRLAALDIAGSLTLAVEVRRAPDGGFRAAATAIAGCLAAAQDVRVDRVVFLPRGALPRTSSGKVRRFLAARQLRGGELEMLADIGHAREADVFGEVVAAALGLPAATIDRDASLAALGCQSLQALEIVRTLGRDNRLTLPSDRFLTDLSIADLEALVAGATQPAVDVGALSEPDPRCLVLAQHAADANDGSLNLAFLARAAGDDAAERLRRAIDAIVGRYPVLRRAPVITDTHLGGVRTVARAPPAVVVVHGMSHDLTANAGRPFQLEREAPCRAVVFDEGRVAEALLVVHHAAADLASMINLARMLAVEWTAPRDAPREKLTEVWPRLPAEAAAYWRSRFANPPPPLFGPPMRHHGRAAYLRMDIGAEPYAALERRAAAWGATAFELSLAAFLRAAADVFDRERLALLTPVSRRAADDLEAVGYFVLPTPIVAKAGRTVALPALVADVRAQLREGVRHGGLPAALALADRAGSDYPAFELALLWQQAYAPGTEALAGLALPDEAEAVSVGELTFRRVSGAVAPSHALELSIAPRAGRLVACLSYDAARVDVAVAATLAAAWAEGLEVDAPPRARVLSSPSRPPPQTLHGLFMEWVAATPNAPALEVDGRTHTYREVAAAVGRIAQTCRGARRVAILCGEEPAGVAAMLAVLIAGAAFVGLKADDPPLRNRHVLEEAEVDLVLTDAEGMADGAGAAFDGLTRVRIEEIEFNGTPGCPLEAMPADPAAPAYLAFTSGSMGRPKGMVHTHATLAAFLAWQAGELDIAPGARPAVLAPMGFDVRYCEVFGSLCFGACAVLSRREDRTPAALMGFLAARRVTAFQVLPSAFARAAPAPLPNLRALFFVGERLPPATVARALKQFGAATRISNVYGPTEVVAATSRWLRPADAEGTQTSAGSAIPGRRLHIVDDDLNLLPCGEVGEILIESDDLCRGYLGLHPVADASFLVEGAFEGQQERAFRTGDAGYVDAGGRLFVLGRRDNQVKLHGVRFELEEIEQVLSAETGAAAAVVARPVGETIVLEAFVETNRVNPEAFRRALLRRLPVSAVPSVFHAAAELPRLSNGKLDRATLGVLVAASAVDGGSSGEAQSRVVADAWRAAIGEAPSSAHVNFFVSGGHSLTALQMINQLSATAGKSLKLAEFLVDPTPARLSIMLSEGA